MKGTKEIKDKLISSHTVYVIEVSVCEVVYNVYLRFSELSKIEEYIKKKFPSVAVPHLEKNVNRHKTKVIESRKLIIESLI